MQEFTYIATFRDHQLPPDDQDAEWVACILIYANSAQAAHDWGDHLATQFAGRVPNEEFIRSYVEPPEMYQDCTSDSSMPRIRQGEEASDEYIGW